MVTCCESLCPKFRQHSIPSKHSRKALADCQLSTTSFPTQSLLLCNIALTGQDCTKAKQFKEKKRSAYSMAYIESRLPHLQRSSSIRTTSDSSVYSYPELRDMNRLSQRMNTSQTSLIYDKTAALLEVDDETTPAMRNLESTKLRSSGAQSSRRELRLDTVHKAARDCTIRQKNANLLDRWSLHGVTSHEITGSSDTHRQHQHHLPQFESIVDEKSTEAQAAEAPGVLTRARSFLSRSVGRTRRTLKVRTGAP